MLGFLGKEIQIWWNMEKYASKYILYMFADQIEPFVPLGKLHFGNE
jgi:hypothetical protein